MHEYYSCPCHTLSVLLLASCMFDFEKIKIPKICMNVREDIKYNFMDFVCNPFFYPKKIEQKT